MGDLGDMRVKVGADISEYVSNINKAVSSNKNLSLSFEELRAKMLVQKALMEGASDPAKIIAYNREIARLNEQMKALASSGMDPVSRGSVKLNNALNNISDGSTIAAREVNNLSRRLLNIGSAFAFGGIVGAVEPVIEVFKEWYATVTQLSEAQKLLKANQGNLNDVMADANKHAGEQITDLKILYETATNVNVSMKDRLAAVRGLQNEFPDFFKNIKQETILNGGAKSSYDALTLSILQTSRAKAAKDKIDELEAKRLDAEYQRTKILTAAENQVNAAYKTGDVKAFNGSVSYNNSNPLISGQSLQATLAAIAARKNAALALVNINDKSLQDQIDFLTKFAGLPSLAKVIEDQNEGKGPKGKKVNQYEIDLAALEQNYEKVRELRVKTLDANLEDSKKNGIVVNDILLADELNFLNAKEALLKKYNKNDFENFKAIEAAKNKLRAQDLDFKNSQIIPDFKISQDKADQISNELREKIKPKIEIFPSEDLIKKGIALDNLIASEEKAAKLTTDVLSPAFESLFQGITSGSHNAFQSFEKSLRSAVEQMAAAILKAAALAAIISLIDPFAGGVPGQSGFGAVFHKLLGFSEGGLVQGYASGGAISGPGSGTSDSILARVSNGEYIIPANVVSALGVGFFDKLRGNPANFSDYLSGRGFPKFAGGGIVNIPSSSIANGLSGSIGGGQHIQVEVVGKLSGNDIWMSNYRTSLTRGRNS